MVLSKDFILPSDASCAATLGEALVTIRFLKQTMHFFDIHTHLTNASLNSIYSCTWKESSVQRQSAYLSASIHPWYLTKENAAQQLAWVKEFAAHTSILAIGEAGLDKTVSTPMELQQSVFKAMIELSEQKQFPLIIHAVKCQEELLAIQKETKPTMPWIIHGFRGKKELAQTYIRHHFYLSLGEHFQKTSLQAIPLDRLLIETDESQAPLENIYTAVAQSYDISIEELDHHIYQNVQALFFTT